MKAFIGSLKPRSATNRGMLALGLLAICAGIWFRVDAMRRQQAEYWRFALAGGAITTRATVDDWYSERVADAVALAQSVTMHAELGAGTDPGRYAPIIIPVETRGSDVRVWIVDSSGTVLAGSGRDSVLDAERAAARRAIASSTPAHSGLSLDGGRVTLTVAAPVSRSPDRPDRAAVVLLRRDVMAPFSSWATGRPNSALSLLVTPAQTGLVLAQVCPGIVPPLCFSAAPSVPATSAGGVALAGRDSFGVFTDVDGRPMFAVTRYDSTLGWGIVRRIAVTDAFAQFRREMAIEGAFLAVLLALLGMGAFTANRGVRLRRLHEQSDADARLSTVVDASIDGLVSLDAQFRITMVNAAIERLFVHRRDWLIGQPVQDLFSPGDRDYLTRRLQRFAQSRDRHGPLTESGRATACRRDGTYFPIDAMLGRATLDGEALFTMGVHDVSDRVRTETFVQGQRQVLELIAAGAPARETIAALIAVVDAQTPTMRGACYELEEDGLVLRLLAAPGLPAAFVAAIDEVIVGPAAGAAGAAVYRGEAVFATDIDADLPGNDAHALARAHEVRAAWGVPLRGADGTLVGALAFYCAESRGPDSLELELAGAAVHLASIALSSARDAVALRSSEASFRSFVENAPAAIFRETRRGHLVSANPAMVTLLGYRSVEALVSAADAGHLYHNAPARSQLLAALEDGDVVRGMEMDWRRADGSSVTVRVSARAYRDDRARVWLWEGFAEDVTPLRQAEQALRRNERLAAVGQLISGVAHELNNPLSSILHFAEDLLADDRTAQDAEALGVIRDQARRSHAIVRDLLSFVQQRTAHTEPVALGETVSRAVRAMTPTATLAGATMSVTVQDDVIVMVDRTGLEQVVTNLLSNAVQAAGAGGEVRVHTECANEWCQIIVEDTGPGIAPDVLPHIFDPFFTTKPTGEGTGLGLSVTLGIVEQFGGRIAAEPRADGAHGTRFVVTLPLAPAGMRPAEAPVREGSAIAAPLETSPEAPAGTPEAPNAPVRRVLVIDDEATIRSALRRYFQRRGWTVDEAADGAAGLAMLESRGDQYTLVVSDLRMPGFSGIELHDQLAARRPDLLRRMVFSTGDVASREAASFVARTRCPMLQKPFELRTLDELIARMTEGVSAAPVVA